MRSHSDSSLETGLTALRQGDYETAIAHLETIATTQSNHQTGLQALRGLALAYERSGEATKAIALCQSLQNSTHPQIKDWAVKTLSVLTKQYHSPDPAPTNVTGFVPLQSPASATPKPPQPPQRDQETEEPSSQAAAPNTQNSSLSTQHSELSTQDSAPNTQNSALHTPPPAFRTEWHNAGRAKHWSKLKQLNLIPFTLLQVGSAVALFWVVRALVQFVMASTNYLLVQLPVVDPIQLFYANPTNGLLILLAVLLVASPWLLDRLLGYFYSQQQLSKSNLNNYSPEALKLLQRYCRQQGWQQPELRILPLSAPMAFSYGHLRRYSRIVVSQGLLEQLEDEEIAAIYASQLGHLHHWDYVVMSLVLAVTILPYLVYKEVSAWGDNSSNKFVRAVAIVVANAAYVVWNLLVGTAMWLSQLRMYYSDRTACQITGNPNALTRALLKITIGVATDITQQGQTSQALECLNILAPISYQQATTLGSIDAHISWESLLSWDYLYPNRWWLSVNNTHPPVGDRLHKLSRIAQYWQLATELQLPSRRQTNNRQRFYLQISPYLGIPLGLALAALIWLIWQFAFNVGVLNLKWIYNDNRFVSGCIFIGFSLGTLIRINPFFPDIKPPRLQTEPNLSSYLTSPTALPVDSNPVSLTGKLLGRRGIGNWLGQDLILQSARGLVRLHHLFLPTSASHPNNLIGRQITLTGWLRRGATAWIDVETLQTQAGKKTSGYHPIFSTVIAMAAAAWGAYILLKS